MEHANARRVEGILKGGADEAGKWKEKGSEGFNAKLTYMR